MRRGNGWCVVAVVLSCAVAQGCGGEPSETSPDGSGGDATGGDICKPIGAGDPIVLVGEGQADYLPLQDHDVAQVEAGPQGGHHIWIALRAKNLLRSGSFSTISGRIDELSHNVPTFSVAFTFDPAEGGYCELHGLRFAIDTDGTDYRTLLGKEMTVTASVTDRDGDVGAGTKIVRLSDDTL